MSTALSGRRAVLLTRFVSAFATPPAAFFAWHIAAGTGGRGVPRGQIDLRAFAQSIHAVDYNQFAGVETGVNYGHIIFRRPGFHIAQRNGTIFFDNVNEEAARAALQRSRWNGSCLAPDVDQHAHVHELVWKEIPVLVGKLRLELHGAGRYIDLVIDGEQDAARELHFLIAIERFNRHSLAGLHALQHQLHAILRNRVNHRYGLQLCYDDEAVRVTGADDI